MFSTSGYMGTTLFRNLVPDVLTYSQLVGTWVQNIFRTLAPNVRRVVFQMLRVMACQCLSCQKVPCLVVSEFCVSACPCHVVATLDNGYLKRCGQMFTLSFAGKAVPLCNSVNISINDVQLQGYNDTQASGLAEIRYCVHIALRHRTGLSLHYSHVWT